MKPAHSPLTSFTQSHRLPFLLLACLLPLSWGVAQEDLFDFGDFGIEEEAPAEDAAQPEEAMPPPEEDAEAAPPEPAPDDLAVPTEEADVEEEAVDDWQPLGEWDEDEADAAEEAEPEAPALDMAGPEEAEPADDEPAAPADDPFGDMDPWDEPEAADAEEPEPADEPDVPAMADPFGPEEVADEADEEDVAAGGPEEPADEQPESEPEQDQSADEQVADEPEADEGPEPIDYDMGAPEEIRAAEIELDEEVRRKEWEQRAEYFMLQAQRAWRDGRFQEAIGLFNKADERLKAISQTQPRIAEKRNRIQEAIASVNASWARSLANEAAQEARTDKFDVAISKAEKAAQTDPSLRKEMDELQRRFTEMKRQAEYQVSVKPNRMIPGLAESEFEINVLLEQGKVYFRAGRYADARDKFEQVLLRDPYEVRAMRYIRAIHQRLIDLSDERRTTTTRERIAEGVWKWNEPVTPLVAKGEEITPQPVPTGGGGLVQKLEDIVIPDIDFNDATIQAVVEFLKKQSIKLDPEGEGVNIILYKDAAAGDEAGTVPEPAPEDDGFGGFDDGGFRDDDFAFGGEAPAEEETFDGGGEPEAAAMGKRITLTLDRIPLGEAIRYICLAAGLKYRVDTNAVIIAGKNVPFEEVETRFYSVEAGVIDVGVDDAGGGGGDFGFDDAGDDGGGDGGGGLTSENLKNFFNDLGVEFPTGSKIAYNERTGKLVVTNTPKNLRQLEKALKEINKTPPQVTIESKFIEVAQNDLQELGFKWLLEEGSGAYEDGIVWGESGDNWALSVLKQTGAAGTKTAPSLGNALRFGHNIFEGVEQGADQILSVNSILGGVNFNTIIHALDQRDNTDILSSPKVTTISGTTAVLKMVETRYIATSWDPPDTTTTGDDSTSFVNSVPNLEEQVLGVILDVTPRVAPDNYSIELELFPRVLDFVGYDDRFNYTQVINDEEVEVKNLTPIIAERSVQTKVIVWDGETVVLGGMIGERISYWEDRVPVLGDIPVLGRLFRSKGELSEKTNLLIFVTARLVNPAGMPRRTSEIRGLPDFRR